MEQTSNFNMRDNIERKQKVITVVKRIYLRLSQLWDYFDSMLDGGMVNNLENAPLMIASPENVYFPNGGGNMNNFLADYHSNIVMGFFFIEGVRYLDHHEANAEFLFPDGGSDLTSQLIADIAGEALRQVLRRIHEAHVLYVTQ